MHDKERRIEDIAGLTYMPDADYMFGKYITMGTKRDLIFDRAIEEGYRAGIRAHTAYFLTSPEAELRALSDKDFTTMIDPLVPQHLSPDDAETWRAYFIVGWTCITLRLVALDEGPL